MVDSRPLHLVSLVGRGSFGIGAVARSLVAEQRRLGRESTIWCVDQPGETEWAADIAGIPRHAIRSFRTLRSFLPGFSPEMESVALAANPETDRFIVHQHSLWSGHSRVTRKLRGRGFQTVICAHGALQTWALNKSSLKKKMAGWAWEYSNLRAADCLHACGENEIDDYRRMGLRNPIALLPNGISNSWVAAAASPALFSARHAPDGRRIMLYFGRITPKKGLPMLLAAMRDLRSKLKHWLLVIAGADEFNHTFELESLVNTLGLGDSVRFVGPIFGQEKRDAFAAAELVVLPTHSEGNPIVILEALGAGIPVLTTRGAPWEDLIRHNCGWWSEVSVRGIGEALEIATASSPGELRAMGLKGQKLVMEKYIWAEVAEKSLRVYDWISGNGNKPECVIT